MPESTQIPGQGALFGDSVPTDREAKAAELQAAAELDIKIPQIAKAGDRRNKPDFDPNHLTEGAHQEISDPATTELQQHGPEPICPAWALPDNAPRVGSYLPDFGPVTELRLAAAQQFAANRYDKFVKELNDWERRARPEIHAARVEKAQAARQAIAQNKPVSKEVAETKETPLRTDGRWDEVRSQINGSPDEGYDIVTRTNVDLEQQADAIHSLMQAPKPRNLDEPPLSDEEIVEGDWPTPPDPSRQIRTRGDQYAFIPPPKPPKPDPNRPDAPGYYHPVSEARRKLKGEPTEELF